MMTNEELRNFLYVSLISADNDELTEEVKQELIQRHKERPYDWKYILQPIESDKVVELFEYLDK